MPSSTTSCVEHPATAAPLAHLRDHHGWQVHELPVDDECRVVLDEIPSAAVGLGTLILAHNETGAIQPVPELAELQLSPVEVRADGVVVHGARATVRRPKVRQDAGRRSISR